MKHSPKKVRDQVIVITGASSGIGLATARLAAERGARVVLASRNLEELQRIVDGIRQAGGLAIAVDCDVADKDEVDKVALAAVSEFGTIDTWVNNAGVSIYGKLTDVHSDEKRRLFDVNFWGVVNGCRSAIRSMRETGGTIINIGSILSERSVPMQGIYVASKHAVKGYTDALRMELEMDKIPIAVCLIKPGAVNTPYVEHARSHLSTSPDNPPPLYAPEVVARAILACAEKPRRDVIVGGSAKIYSWLEKFAPGLTDKMMELKMGKAQESSAPKLGADALFIPPEYEGNTRGPGGKLTRSSSLYTATVLHPGKAVALGAIFSAMAIGGATVAINAKRKRGKGPLHWLTNL